MEEIDALYRRLIRQVHPDAGPPDQRGLRNILSQQINEARRNRDIDLLRRLSIEVEQIVRTSAESEYDEEPSNEYQDGSSNTTKADGVPDDASSHGPEPDEYTSTAGYDGPDDPNESSPTERKRGYRRLDVNKLMTRNVAIRVSIAIALILISLFTNRSFLGWGLFAVLAVLVVPFGRSRSFLASFVPYATVWFVFTFLRSLADETRWAQTVNTKVAQFERWLFNGELPSIRLQADFYTPGNLHWYDYYFTFVHWSYFIIPHAVAIFLWWKFFPLFRRYLIALTMLLTMGLGLYFLLPSNPPWMAPESVNTPGAPTVLRIMEPIGKQLGGGLYQAGYSVVGESNPIAAMPSIHFAVTFLLVMTAYSFSNRWQIAAWFYAISMGLALVYMGEHYVVDVLVGGGITAFSWYLAGVWLRSGRSLIPAWRRGEAVVPVSQYPGPAT